ncbi:MAG: NAD-dependent epimerase/dehydratase family protein [Planctomycetota bacterium]
MSRRALITGSSGFIGSALVRRLRENGWLTAGIGRRPLAVDGYHSHDLGEPLPASFDGAYDTVVHAAARSSPWGSRREFERDNVAATQNVVDFCRRNGVPRLVYISSSSVYYRAEHQFEITEATPLADRAVSLYAETKLKGEEVVRRYEGSWTILRPRAVYGPGDVVLLPRIVRAARAGRLPLITPAEGPVVGDLIYIENLLDQIEAVVGDANVAGDFNLTDNRPVPIIDFLRGIFDRLAIPQPKRRLSVRTAMLGASVLETVHRLFLPAREPAITRFGVHVFAYSKTFDVQRMLTRLSQPRVSLEESVERTVEWMTNRDAEVDR